MGCRGGPHRSSAAWKGFPISFLHPFAHSLLHPPPFSVSLPSLACMARLSKGSWDERMDRYPTVVRIDTTKGSYRWRGREWTLGATPVSKETWWTCAMEANDEEGDGKDDVVMEEDGRESNTTTYAVRALHTSLRQHRNYDVARFADPPPDWTRCEGEGHVRKEGNGVRTVSCGSGTSMRRWRGVMERVGGGSTAHYALVMQGEDVVALPLDSWYTYRNAPLHEGERPSTLEEAESAMQARQLVHGNVLPKLRQQSEQAHSTHVHGGGLRWNQATDRDHEEDSDRDVGGQEESEDDGRVERTRHAKHASRQGSRSERDPDARRRGDVDVDATNDKAGERRERSDGMDDDERSDASEDGPEEDQEDKEGGKEDWEFEENATDDEEEQKDVRARASYATGGRRPLPSKQEG